MADDCLDLENIMGNLACYFDYDAYATDLFINDFTFYRGYVFRCY